MRLRDSQPMRRRKSPYILGSKSNSMIAARFTSAARPQNLRRRHPLCLHVFAEENEASSPRELIDQARNPNGSEMIPFPASDV
jgi:hypothetical protein